MKTYEIIQAEPLQKKLCELMGLDPGMVASMTIHLEPAAPIVINVTLFADKKILDIDFSQFSRVMEIEK